MSVGVRMTGERRWTRLLVALAGTVLAVPVLLATLAPPATAAPVRYGDCEVDVVVPEPDGMVVVTVRNRGGQRFGPVSVELWRADLRIAQASTGALASGASTVVRLPVRDGSAGAYLVVDFELGGVRQEFAVPLPPDLGGGSAGPGGTLLAWLTPLLGFAGALLGVWLGHVTSARRERVRTTVDAGWKRVDRDGPAYRTFLEYWQGSISASHLEGAFGQLRAAASVPADVTREYERTIRVLRLTDATDEAKRAAATRLRRAVEALRTHQG